MKTSTPYLIGRSTPLTLHIGSYCDTKNAAMIFEPIELPDCEIVMCETSGPLIAHLDKLWPVRAYNVSVSLDRLMCIERYRNSEHARHLYPFERMVAHGEMIRLKKGMDGGLPKQAGKPLRTTAKKLESLYKLALLMPTDTPGEVRLLKPLNACLNEMPARSPAHAR